MKASYRWLSELLGASFDASPEDVARRFTGAGLEVEGATKFGEAAEKVVVAKVVAKDPHPSKAKLSLVTVETGHGTQRVVCGAPNVPAPGGLVALAPLGTRLPAKNMVMEPREIAGVLSEGMLCSEAELGLRISGGEGGILILPEGTAAAGASLSNAIASSFDVIFEIGLTPNRPDGLGHLGLARELAALYGIPFVHAAPKASRVDASLSVAKAATITIEDGERCPIYGGAYVKGVKVGPAPLWMQYRLEALGVRAISNVVDITNYVMLKYGHPIHGFDLDRVRGKSIIVRRAAEGEPVKTLDGVDRKLAADDLVIADKGGTVALAGVMGAEGSGIVDTTSEVLIECAYFVPRGVRRTARRHGMHTESSHRFERGVDPGDVKDVLAETAELLCSVAGGTAAPEPALYGPGVPARPAIRLRASAMTSLLGVDVTLAEAKVLLERLGCKQSGADSASEMSFVPPTHRPDLAIEADLIEEVIRLKGVDSIPSVVPAIKPGTPRTHEAVAQAVVRAAIDVGLSQALTFAFTSPQMLEAVRAPAPAFALANPLSDDRTVMRTSLLPGLLEAVRRSRRHGVPNVRVFQTGAKYLAGTGGLSHEARSFAAAIAGARDAVLAKAEPIDLYDAKGIAVAVIERAIRRTPEVKPADPRPEHLHPRAAGELWVEGERVGTFGMLHPKVDRALELDGPVAIVEIDLEGLERAGIRTPKYRPIPTLPAATRDMSVTVAEGVSAGAVGKAIGEAAGELAESVELFDVYRNDEKLGAGKKALAFRVVYRDPKSATDPDKAKTLTDAEVDTRHKAAEKTVLEKFGAELRA